jgi:hypothetical protein
VKFGEDVDSIFSHTFGLDLGGARVEGFPAADTVKLLTYVDGSQERVDFGARVERRASLTFSGIAKASYLAILTYLKAEKGNKIRVTLSRAAENVWAVSSLVSSSRFYAYVLDFSDQGEGDFSVSDSL